MTAINTPIDAATEAWTLSALMLGFNELARQADTLGQRALARMFRDDAQRRLVEGGHARVNMTRPREILVLREQPHLAFDERDVELMRACVAQWDMKKAAEGSPGYMSPEQAGAPISDTERTQMLFLLGALQVAPGDASRLIAIVDHDGGSPGFLDALRRLREATDVAAAATEMREALR